MSRGDQLASATPASEKWPRGKVPFWVGEAFAQDPRWTPQAPLSGQQQADVAIVGGGFTGLWAALALRQRRPQARIVVLEAQFCAAGASGMNGGFSHGYWDALPRLLQDFGEADALAIAEAGSEAQRQIERFCSEHAPQARFSAGGRVKLASSARQLERFDEYFRIARVYGLGDRIRAADPREIAGYCRLPSVVGGIHFAETATVQPAQLVLALRREALRRGVRIHEASPVRGVQEARDGYVVQTTAGSVLAGDVVLASNASLATHPLLRRKLTNFSSYVLATRPIPDKLRQMGWNSDIGFSTAKMFLNWFRQTLDPRIVFGTGGGPIGFNGASSGALLQHPGTYRKLLGDFLQMFPQCTASDIACDWAGAVELSTDRLPFFGTLPGTRIHYGCGYSGHGVNATWIGGRILAELVTGDAAEWSRLPFHTRAVADWPREPFRYLGGRLFRSGLMAYEDALEAGRAPSLYASLVQRLSSIGPVRLGAR